MPRGCGRRSAPLFEVNAAGIEESATRDRQRATTRLYGTPSDADRLSPPTTSSGGPPGSGASAAGSPAERRGGASAPGAVPAPTPRTAPGRTAAIVDGAAAAAGPRPRGGGPAVRSRSPVHADRVGRLAPGHGEAPSRRRRKARSHPAGHGRDLRLPLRIARVPSFRHPQAGNGSFARAVTAYAPVADRRGTLVSP